ncbi:MAG: hypothetical protein QNJ55_31935 [Xenococcus sp. MO_188.B8]|nr:hypothetical protein [Xenococcus sp. MO_188.B8]
MIRILVVDDKKIIQEIIKGLFAEVSDFEGVVTFSNGYYAIAF